MKRVVYIICFLLVVGQSALVAQDDLLKGVEEDGPKKEYIFNAFKSSRVINGHSMEFIGKGVLDFRILHRFGRINQGVKELFGFDQASMRMGFDYGLGKNLTVGIGRTTFNKELDGFIKLRPFQQARGPGSSPVSIVLVAGISINTVANNNPAKEISLQKRTGYYYQTIIGRKFSERFTLQLSPTMVHRNEVVKEDDNDIYALGIGSRFKLSKRVAFVADYFYVMNGLPEEVNRNPLSLGFDIETGGHVFQLHFSNTNGMNEQAFITQTTDQFFKGDIHFGFNLSRVFTINGQKKRQK
jgi:hypothetical protein